MKYRFIIEDEVLNEFLFLPKRKRETLLDALSLVADQAPLAGEFSHIDENSRRIEYKVFRKWKVWFWYDGPVKEVRIVDTEYL
jgi:hypothetical protein